AHLSEDQREYGEAITWAQRLLRQDPLHESTYRRLMRLYALTENRAAALRAYHACVSVLEQELDVEPDQKTRQLYERLLLAEDRAEPPAPAERRIPTTRLVGRQTEWQQMLTLWQRVSRGESHLLLVSGEAGMGKSRLVEELVNWVSRQGLPTAYARAFAAAGELAYEPIAEWLRGESLVGSLAELDRVWLTEVSRLLPELRHLHPELPHPIALTDGWQRRHFWEGLAQPFLAEREAKVLWLDDLQWCDGETLAWIGYLLQLAPGTPLLVAGTVRPEEIDGSHPLRDLTMALARLGRVTEIDLRPLDATASAQLAGQVLAQILDPASQYLLYRQSEGNPLFVIETALAGLGPLLADPSDHSSVADLPGPIYELIRARLHRLSPPAQQIAGLAAVIGRTFSFPILTTAASSFDEAQVIGALDELWQRRIIREQGVNAYDFSHDRIRDVAYAEIGPVRQPYLHRAVARAIETVNASGLAEVASRLAMQWERGGEFERAIGYYQQAADVAQGRLSAREQLAHLRSALRLLDELPETTEHQQQRLDILLVMILPILTLYGWSPVELLPHCLATHELCQAIGSPNQRTQILFQLRSYFGMRGQHRESLSYAEQSLELAYQMKEESAWQDREMAHNSMASVRLRLGELLSAHEHFILAGAEQAGNAPFQILVKWLLGYTDQALRMAADYRALSTLPIYKKAIVLTVTIYIWYATRAEAALRGYLSATIALADQYELAFWQVVAAFFRGWLAIQNGGRQDGLEEMERAIREMEEVGCGVLTFFLCILAEAYCLAEDFSAAESALERAFERAHSGDERFWYAELLRQRGQLLALRHAPAVQVEACYREALEVARQQAAKSLELRAAISLAQLWQAQGRTAEAQKLLAGVYNWFTEGFGTADLIDARTLLAELS
ncbi:MAG: AAA family ATPase, partial [Caldilineaceae bacterium]